MSRLSDSLLDQLLLQDVPLGDLTTEGLGIGARSAEITYCARNPMVLCGSEEAGRMLEMRGVRIDHLLPSGRMLAAGEIFLSAQGSAQSLHAVWKISQTLVEYLSGIATRTRRIVDAARNVAPETVIACTRKNFPGTKEVSIRAIRAGGGIMHRLGLSETILVFPEHLAFVDEPPDIWMTKLRAQAPEKKIVVEAATVEAAEQLIACGADVIQLEKFSPQETAVVVDLARRQRPSPVVAVAGGVTEDNVGAFVETGCRLIVTSAPFFGKPCDVKVTLKPC
ncbi:molybdenum transport protein [Ciceribacter lividus]|uniref:Putative pyrophosphorylase ModD n=1 Tax=Ciceribacter lividus TaxID=1197950 RepID=A0A6I7HM54_9HYPH|nr:ModD protein [Ciceribacter lividus]RCW23141.1 molybdenum transport protein [Ciceribacter lividus]